MRAVMLVPLLSLFAVEARAEMDAAPKCWRFASETGPEAMPESEHDHGVAARPETWCYRVRTMTGGAETLVYNADGDVAKPELSMLVETDANGKILNVAFGSLARGEMTLHRVAVDGFNPMPVPMTAELAQAKGFAGLSLDKAELHDSALELFDVLGQVSHERTLQMAVEEGTFESNLEASRLPYRAYWWPHSGVPLAAGDFSPLGKYDAAVAARTGVSPRSVDWERANHSLEHVTWGGHCNGWAASSVLYAEPTKRLWDPMSQRVFTPSDFEGILAEASFCVHWAFYGQRYRGAGDDLSDIAPELFHKTLITYIDELKKPIAFDYIRDTSVDNNVISGYRMTVTKIGEGKYRVSARVRTHDYDHNRNDTAGAAYTTTRTYEYELTVDAAGEITGGTWISSNPDFLWVPLAQKACGRENPHIDHRRVEQLLATLPEATTQVVENPIAVTIDLAAGETVDLGLPMLRGMDFRLDFGAVAGPADVDVVAEGFQTFPTNYTASKTARTFALSSLDNRTISLSWEELSALKLVSRSAVTSPVTVNLRRVERVGGR